MTVTPQFLKIYNATFQWIEEHFGYAALVDYWKELAAYVAFDLREAAISKGVQGCAEYWRRVLTEEGVNYKLYVYHRTDTQSDVMQLDIADCSSRKAIGTPCEHYCNHCEVIYREILNAAGLKYEWEKTGTDSCRIRVLSSLVEEVKRKRLPMLSTAS